MMADILTEASAEVPVSQWGDRNGDSQGTTPDWLVLASYRRWKR